jgi:ATP-dependent exoDNAse (exonuclease V) alpha subunit
VRDKVIQTVNDYDRDVYNGDIGTVVSLHTEPCGGGGGRGGGARVEVRGRSAAAAAVVA